MIAGVCLLFILTIAECRFEFVTEMDPKQFGDCGDIFDTSTPLGQCFGYVFADDEDGFCESDSDCEQLVIDWFECVDVDLSDYGIEDGDIEDICDAVTVASISTVTTILVAIAAALN